MIASVSTLRGLRSWLQATGAILLCCTLLALRHAVELHEDWDFHNGPMRWGPAIQLTVLDWWPWLFVSPLLGFLGLRFPLARRRWWLALAVHLPASLSIGVLRWVEISYNWEEFVPVFDAYGVSFGEITRGALTYLVFLISLSAFLAYREHKEREAEAERLTSQLTQAQLQMLRMQLHPHFLFNTLNAISTLMHRDAEAADEMLSKLSELLRLSFSNLRMNEVPLAKELEFLDRYLEILQIRFGDNLQVRKQVEANSEAALVPTLILQPVVENAVEHGVGKRAKGGRITLACRRRGDELELIVEDNGPGLPEAEELPMFGVGLSNTQARLENLYGPQARMAFEPVDGTGLRVRLNLPYRIGAE